MRILNLELELWPDTTAYWRCLRLMADVLADLRKTEYAIATLKEFDGDGLPSDLPVAALADPDVSLTPGQHLRCLIIGQKIAMVALGWAVLEEDPEAIFLIAYYNDLLADAARHMGIIASRLSELGLLDCLILTETRGGDN